jgi:hypothetical protein
VTASICASSSIHTVLPAAASSASAKSRPCVSTRSLANRPVTPAPSRAGRVRHRPHHRHAAPEPALQLRGSDAGRDGDHQWLRRLCLCAANASHTARKTCGLVANTQVEAPATASAPSSNTATPKSAASASRSEGTGSATWIVAGSRPCDDQPADQAARHVAAADEGDRVAPRVVLRLGWPRPEQRAADAHHRRTFLDGGHEVLAHAHRQRIDPGMPRLQSHRTDARIARNASRRRAMSSKRRGDRHQPAQPQARLRGHGVGQRVDVLVGGSRACSPHRRR